MSLMIVISKFKNYFMKNTVLLFSILLGAIDCYFAQVKVPEWTKNATGKYSDLFSSKKKKIKNGTRIKLGAWGYRIYYL